MARRSFSPEELQELRELAAGWGKLIARRTGDDALDLDLDAMEQIAQAAAAGLLEGTLDLLLRRQADALGSQQPCPACGRLCPLDYQERTLHVKGGVPLPHQEPVAHCPDCRRDFFPPTTAPAS